MRRSVLDPVSIAARIYDNVKGAAILSRKKIRKSYESNRAILLTLALWAVAGMPSPLHSQTGCVAPAASDFHKVDLGMDGLSTPTDIQVAPDGRVFINELLTGEIKIFRDGGTPRLVVAGKIPVVGSNERGVSGMVLDPAFAQNHWIYVRNAPAGKTVDEVSRFTMKGDSLQLASRKILVSIPRDDDAHQGGGMAFDNLGNLLFSYGEDGRPSANDGYASIDSRTKITDAERTAGNTNDLRGKINRIKPRPFPDSETPAPGIGSTYDIPAGNFWETIAATLPGADMTKVRKEIFAMGFRNPYRFSVDPATNWLVSGEIGPDANRDDPLRGRAGHDEVNVTKQGGGYYGWPYCNGNNFAYNQVDFSGAQPVHLAAKFDCARPVNNSPFNTGLTVLPPSIPPIIWYAASNTIDFPELGQGQEAVMVGPFYRYDPTLKSDVKFPPYYNGKAHIWCWQRLWHKFLALDAQGGLAKLEDFSIPGHTWGSDISVKYGVNGAMYVLQWSQHGYIGGDRAFYKIEYRGPLNESGCASALKPKEPVDKNDRLWPILIGPSGLDLPPGVNGVEIFGLDGRKLWRCHRTGTADRMERVFVPKPAQRGMVLIRFLKRGE